MRVSLLLLPLAGCGSVLLGEEPAAEDAGNDAGSGAVFVAVSVGQVSCGCVEVTTLAAGGQAPYELIWQDGEHADQRRICGQGSQELRVVAHDSAGHRSAEHVTRVDLGDAGCPDAAPQLLCLENGSFEGTPAANLGVPGTFDAPPWSLCTNPANVANTPSIGNDTIKQMIATVPPTTNGMTMLALGEGQQVSQKLCEPVASGQTRSFTIDLARINVGAGVVPETEEIYLEVWGGTAAQCIQREQLWASGPLQVGWKSYCITIQPRTYMDQLTLRANTDKSQIPLGYLVADHLVPVASCP